MATYDDLHTAILFEKKNWVAQISSLHLPSTSIQLINKVVFKLEVVFSFR